MPTYEYRREDGTTFEIFQRITDAALTEDPATGQKVERVISGGAGLQFKGTGFYLTDYGRAGTDIGSSNGKEDGEESASSKTEKKSATKTDTKSDAKSESSAETESTSSDASSSGDSAE